MSQQAHGLTNAQATQIGAKTLWIGDIEQWMDENYITGLFNGIASIQSVKLIRDKIKMTPVGYGFVEFPNHEIAKNVYINLNGTTIPGTQRAFKLNWASHGTSRHHQDGGPEIREGSAPRQGAGDYAGGSMQGSVGGGSSQGVGAGQPSSVVPGQTPSGNFQVYIGNLDPNVNNSYLMSVFSKKYPSIYEAKVIVDQVTKMSKGYGFLTFGQQEQAQTAITEMQGVPIMHRQIKLNYAAQRKAPGDITNKNAPPPTTFSQYQAGQAPPGGQHMQGGLPGAAGAGAGAGYYGNQGYNGAAAGGYGAYGHNPPPPPLDYYGNPLSGYPGGPMGGQYGGQSQGPHGGYGMGGAAGGPQGMYGQLGGYPGGPGGHYGSMPPPGYDQGQQPWMGGPLPPYQHGQQPGSFYQGGPPPAMPSQGGAPPNGQPQSPTATGEGHPPPHSDQHHLPPYQSSLPLDQQQFTSPSHQQQHQLFPGAGGQGGPPGSHLEQPDGSRQPIHDPNQIQNVHPVQQPEDLANLAEQKQQAAPADNVNDQIKEQWTGGDYQNQQQLQQQIDNSEQQEQSKPNNPASNFDARAAPEAQEQQQPQSEAGRSQAQPDMGLPLMPPPYGIMGGFPGQLPGPPLMPGQQPPHPHGLMNMPQMGNLPPAPPAQIKKRSQVAQVRLNEKTVDIMNKQFLDEKFEDPEVLYYV